MYSIPTDTARREELIYLDFSLSEILEIIIAISDAVVF